MISRLVVRLVGPWVGRLVGGSGAQRTEDGEDNGHDGTDGDGADGASTNDDGRRTTTTLHLLKWLQKLHDKFLPRSSM